MAKKPNGGGVELLALHPESVKVSALKPHPKNPNTHPDEQITGLGGAFKEFGVTSVLVADEHYQILAGEGRWRSAQREGLDALAVVVVRGWSEERKLAFMLSDNQWAKLSVWNQPLLLANVQQLQGANFDLDLTGFSKPLLQELGAIEPEPSDPNKGRLLELINITIADPKTKVEHGEHWVLSGRHHLLVESVISGWKKWAPLLKDDELFCPYPGVFVPFGSKAKKHVLVMVQSDEYIAGHILDRWTEVHGKKAIKKV